MIMIIIIVAFINHNIFTVTTILPIIADGIWGGLTALSVSSSSSSYVCAVRSYGVEWWLVSGDGGEEGDGQRHHVDRQLELQELPDVVEHAPEARNNNNLIIIIIIVVISIIITSPSSSSSSSSSAMSSPITTHVPFVPSIPLIPVLLRLPLPAPEDGVDNAGEVVTIIIFTLSSRTPPPPPPPSHHQSVPSSPYLPQSTALTMEAKLSSMMTMSEASLATSVPDRPIDKPTSAT
jgi:hypothetical protein